MRDNNFDTMRLCAALAVIISHSFPLSYGADCPQPLQILSNSQTSLGEIAVAVFFIISGYLITASFRHRKPLQFLVSRSLRIMPALGVFLVIMTFAIAPIVTNLTIKEYFGSAQTYHFFYSNLLFFNTTDMLPGVFQHNPLPFHVDGSLWTLRYEVECYLLVFLLGISGALNRYILLILLCGTLSLSLFWIGGSRILFYSYFLGGANLYAWRLSFRPWLPVVAAALLGLAFHTGFRLAAATAGAALVLFIGLSPTIRFWKVARLGDLSYGAYIWGWPVQQLIAMQGGMFTIWYVNLAATLPIVLGLSWLSWHVVESRALSLKHRAATADRLVKIKTKRPGVFTGRPWRSERVLE